VKPTRSVLPAKLCLVTVRPVAGASIIMSWPPTTMELTDRVITRQVSQSI